MKTGIIHYGRGVYYKSVIEAAESARNVVVNNIDGPETYVGNPAKRIK